MHIPTPSLCCVLDATRPEDASGYFGSGHAPSG